jgi:hypothetical protein
MKTKIIQDEQRPHPVAIIADAIVEISKGMRRLNASRLTRDAVVTLIARNSKVSRSDIETVLENLDDLDTRWLKKPVISRLTAQFALSEKTQ